MVMSEDDTKRMKAFQQLWKTDDKAWMQQRREDWKHIEEYYKNKGAPKSEVSQYRNFFLKGQIEGYISNVVLYFCTPVSNADEARELFKSELWLIRERGRLATDYIFRATEIGQGLPWLRQHIQYFVEGVLGNEYHYAEESEAGMMHAVSLHPGFWCEKFIYHAVRLLSGKIDYHGCVEAVNYFVTAIAHSDDAYYRDIEDFQQMNSLIDKVLADEDATEVARELATKLNARRQEIINNWELHAHLDKE